MKILLSKPSIPKLFAQQPGWQRALISLFIGHPNTGSNNKRQSLDLEPNVLVDPLQSSNSESKPVNKSTRFSARQPSICSATGNDVDFDCGDDFDDFIMPSSPPKFPYGEFLSDPYSSQRRPSSEDDFDALVGSRGIMKSMRSASCTSNLSQV
jgi:hypothetical protein